MKASKAVRVVMSCLLVTLVFYALFAWVLSGHPTWLSSKVPDGTVTSKVMLAMQRAARNGLIVGLTAAAIYLLYRGLSLWPAFKARRINSEAVSPAQVARELALSANLVVAGGIQGIIYAILTELGHSRIYPNIDERGWLYALVSVLVYVLVADTWFYFSHRLLHGVDVLYRTIHGVHHLSVNTTALTTNQFSPLELISSGLMGVLFIVLVPLASPVIFAMVVGLTIYQMLVHSGTELFPAGTATSRLGKWFVTPTYHQMHHELSNRHLGLYFTWWDRWCGTYSETYEDRFGAVTARPGRDPRPTAPSPSGGQVS